MKFIQELVQENKYFVLRIKNNWKLKFEDASGLVKVGASDDAQAYSGLVKVGASDDAQAYRVINFCDLETKTE